MIVHCRSKDVRLDDHDEDDNEQENRSRTFRRTILLRGEQIPLS